MLNDVKPLSELCTANFNVRLNLQKLKIYGQCNQILQSEIHWKTKLSDVNEDDNNIKQHTVIPAKSVEIKSIYIYIYTQEIDNLRFIYIQLIKGYFRLHSKFNLLLFTTILRSQIIRMGIIQIYQKGHQNYKTTRYNVYKTKEIFFVVFNHK